MHYPSIVIFSFFLLLESATLTTLTLPLSAASPASLLTLNNHTNINIPLYLTEALCARITDPPLAGLNPSNCDIVAEITCQRLVNVPREHLVQETWIWSELEGCAMGYYLPDGARVPNRHTCEGVIMKEITEKCARDSRFNAGSINVERLPNFADDRTGDY